MPRHPHTASTTKSLSAGVFSQLAKKAREHRGHVHPLHVGDTYLDPFPAARAEAQRSTDHRLLHNYAPVQGEPALLAAIARRLEKRTGDPVPVDRIQVMAGATSGLSVVCATIVDHGDEVIVPAPFWPLIRGIVASRGGVPVQLPFFDRLRDPSFDPERALAETITDRTVALYLNTPSNPTGATIPPDVITAMLRVAKKHGLWVLCDEAYEELWFTEQRPAPVWAHPDARDRAIATHTLSKSYGLAGARVGFTHGPADVMLAVRAVQTFQTYCAPRPMQLGAVRALDEGDGWLAEARAAYRAAGYEAADALGIDRPTGGTFLFFDVGEHLREGETPLGFLERCLDAGVLLTPGDACGTAYERWVRLCFTSVPPAELREALDRLRTVITPRSR